MIVRTPYRVIYGDTDCGGVMYYGNYLRLFEIGRTEWIRRVGIAYKEIEERFEVILPVVEVFAKYKSPAFYDDLLEIETRLTEAKPLKLRFDYRIFREGNLLVQGYTVHVPIGKDMKAKRLPVELYELLKNHTTSLSSERD